MTEPGYLGPAIAATKDRPVRILFRNLLPTGLEGNLFIPTDITVMGSGMGPSLGGMIEDPAGQVDPMCGQSTRTDPESRKAASPRTAPPCTCTAASRPGSATARRTSGSPPQVRGRTQPRLGKTRASAWPTCPICGSTRQRRYDFQCAGQTTCDVAGATNDPGEGAQTYYWTNQQSARLMFYHDHAWGITRLNVYAGEAAAYLITDDTEQSLIDQGLIPGPADTIPLVVQDRTFVPSPEQIALQDSTWDYDRWGGEGNLWLPHVYSPAQNPGDTSGVNDSAAGPTGPGSGRLP